MSNTRTYYHNVQSGGLLRSHFAEHSAESLLKLVNMQGNMKICAAKDGKRGSIRSLLDAADPCKDDIEVSI